MRPLPFIIASVLLMLAAGVLAGCKASFSTIKDRGVYTTLAIEGHPLDMPGSSYTAYKNFGPGQTPAAVIVGYGSWDGVYTHPQQFDLQVIEGGTGAMVIETVGSEYAGKAAFVNLPIRKSGNYQLKLLIDRSVSDTWNFTVDRGTVGEDTAQNAAEPAYAKHFSESMVTRDEGFAEYDTYFLDAVKNAVERASNKAADRSIFSQVPAGKVAVRFQLDKAGNVNSPQIIENTLGEALGQFFLQALHDGAPYKAWSAATPTRQMNLTFYYD